MIDENLRKIARSLNDDGKSHSDISDVLKISQWRARNLCCYKLKAIKMKRGPNQKLGNKSIYTIRREITLIKDVGERVNSTKKRKKCELNISKTTGWDYMNKIVFKYCEI